MKSGQAEESKQLNRRRHQWSLDAELKEIHKEALGAGMERSEGILEETHKGSEA